MRLVHLFRLLELLEPVPSCVQIHRLALSSVLHLMSMAMVKHKRVVPKSIPVGWMMVLLAMMVALAMQAIAPAVVQSVPFWQS